MPELPEVETTRRGIEAHVVNNKIKSFVVRQRQLRWLIPDDIDNLRNGVIGSVERRGKYLILRTTLGDIIIHLGMSGSLRICKATEPATAHDHIDICLEGGNALRMRDPRKFGAVLTASNAYTHKLIRSLGPEPLTESLSGLYLYEKSKGKTRALKKFIMDLHVVVGVGNIYANEALFIAGIKPTTQAGRVSLTRFNNLSDAIKLVLAKAIKAGGTTLKDFVNGEGKPGYFKNELQVYGRATLLCTKCESKLLEIRIDNRSTVYCKRCQT